MVYNIPDPNERAVKATTKLTDFSNVNWSNSLKRLFPEEDEDWGTDLRKLFGVVTRPFYELDLEAISKGPALFVSVADYSCSDEDMEGEPGFAAYDVPITRAGKKPSLFKSSASQKYTRRSGRVFPQRRALKILSKTLRGGIYENKNIEYGSYGPCGHEL